MARKPKPRGNSRSKFTRSTRPNNNEPGRMVLLASRGDAYLRYKRTTTAFCDGLADCLPQSSNHRIPLTSVSDLATAADLIYSEALDAAKSYNFKKTLDPQLLDNLQETIALREMVGATYQEDRDDGHAFILQVLKYCYHVLRKTRRLQCCQKGSRKTNNGGSPSTEQENHTAYKNDTFVNSFHTLQLAQGEDDDMSDTEDPEEAEESERMRRPSEPAKPYRIHQDLIEGSFKFQAGLFFLTADQLFGIVHDSYATLKADMARIKESSNHQDYRKQNHDTMVALLQSAASIDLVLENLQCLEQSMALACPHFCNIYWIFAVLVFSKSIHEIEDLLGDDVYLCKSPNTCIILWISGCVRFGFLGRSYAIGQGFYDDLLHEIFEGKKKTSPIDPHVLDQIRQIGLSVAAAAEMECAAGALSKHMSETIAEYSLTYFNPKDKSQEQEVIIPVRPDWLKNYKHLGGKDGLMYTLVTLERMMNSVFTCPTIEELRSRKSKWEEWQEGCSSLQQSVEGMFKVFGYCIFPRLMLEHFYKEGMGMILEAKHFPPHTGFLHDIQKLLQNREKGITFASAFGVHVLIQGMHMLQGEDDDLKRLAVVSSITMNKYESHWNDIQKTPYVDSLKFFFPGGLGKLIAWQAVMDRTPIHDFPISIQAQWNPLVAGSLLLSTVYGSNITMGLQHADQTKQLRTTLHLYNGLRQRGLLTEPIDTLEYLDGIFAENEHIWPADGGKPRTNGFLKSFCLADGLTDRLAEKFVGFIMIPDEERKLIDSILSWTAKYTFASTQGLTEEQTYAMKRGFHLIGIGTDHGRYDMRMNRFSDQSVSKAYLVDKQFKDGALLQQKQHIQDGVFPDLGAVCSHRANLTREAIRVDHALLGTNWLMVGHLLNNFMEIVDKELLIEEYTTLMSESVWTGRRMPFEKSPQHRKGMMRDAANKFLADMVFRELEFGDESSNFVNSKIVARLMSSYFSNIATVGKVTLF